MRTLGEDSLDVGIEGVLFTKEMQEFEGLEETGV
jgi:hypothetical protein